MKGFYSVLVALGVLVLPASVAVRPRRSPISRHGPF